MSSYAFGVAGDRASAVRVNRRLLNLPSTAAQDGLAAGAEEMRGHTGIRDGVVHGGPHAFAAGAGLRDLDIAHGVTKPQGPRAFRRR